VHREQREVGVVEREVFGLKEFVDEVDAREMTQNRLEIVTRVEDEESRDGNPGVGGRKHAKTKSKIQIQSKSKAKDK